MQGIAQGEHVFYSVMMRWDNLLADPDRVETAKLPLFKDEALIRRLNTPEFKGITFYEVMAKSIINHVPSERLGFNWTLNPYRGCSHACSYCLDAETPVLMGDGRTKKLKDVIVGDEIYGTAREGNYRRYVKTQVLNHWSTVKPAYRVTLEDGTSFISSADHRFLTDRGWKHVRPLQPGEGQRPHLTFNNSMLGTGKFASPPKANRQYRRGYLCGMIRGDGHLGSYSYIRAGRTNGDVHRFRLALVDFEALQRSRQYLADFDVMTREFVFKAAAGDTRKIDAIRSSARGSIEAIKEMICWPTEPSRDWCKGFLAGIFDAEGSYSRGILRFSNTDQEIIDKITLCLRRLGLFWVTEECRQQGVRKEVQSVRILGGLQEALRFFHMVGPAITRKISIEGQAIKNDARLRVKGVESLGLELPLFDITTGTGDFIANGVVSHNCFARPTHSYLDFNAGEDFQTKIVVKVNAVELLRAGLKKPSWSGESIAMGTNTDNYQRAEGHYKLMRGILKELNAARNPYSILTKSTLIKRDIDLLAEGASMMDVSTSFSVGTVDEEVWRKTEPGTPHPRKRLEVLRMLNEAGVPCGVLMAPILPGISDAPEQLEATVEAIASAGATHITPLILHLRPGVKEEFMPWLEDNYPELVLPYSQIYKRSNAPKDVREPITKAVANLKRRHKPSPAPKRHSYRTEKKDSKKSKEAVEEGATQMELDLGKEPARRAPKWAVQAIRDRPRAPAPKKVHSGRAS